MNKPGFCGHNSSADVLGSGDIDSVVLLHRPPYTHHASEMDNSADPLHRRDQSFRSADISSVDHDPALLEPTRVFGRQGEHPHAMPAIMKSRDEVPPNKTIAPDDEDLAHTSTST